MIGFIANIIQTFTLKMMDKEALRMECLNSARSGDISRFNDSVYYLRSQIGQDDLNLILLESLPIAITRNQTEMCKNIADKLFGMGYFLPTWKIELHNQLCQPTSRAYDIASLFNLLNKIGLTWSRYEIYHRVIGLAPEEDIIELNELIYNHHEQMRYESNIELYEELLRKVNCKVKIVGYVRGIEILLDNGLTFESNKKIFNHVLESREPYEVARDIIELINTLASQKARGDEDRRWDAVNQYYARHPDQIKLSKTIPGLNETFINIDTQIFQIKDTLGKGGFGKAKYGVTEHGLPITVKFENRGAALNDSREEAILKQLGYYFGSKERNTLGKQTLIKAIKYVDGISLRDALDSKIFSEKDKWIIALKACLKLKALHDLNIIHRDIKPENIIVKKEGEMIVLDYIDFGLSIQLNPTEQFYQSASSRASGTHGYIAPESLHSQVYSFDSDIYSLGIMFGSDLGLPESLYLGMIHEFKARDSIDSIILKIRDHLQSEYGYCDTKNRSKQRSRLDSKCDYSGEAASSSGNALQSESRSRKRHCH